MGNPFSGLGEAMISGINIQPGIVRWFLMGLSMSALFLYKWQAT
jgi:hypothetical protein